MNYYKYIIESSDYMAKKAMESVEYTDIWVPVESSIYGTMYHKIEKEISNFVQIEVRNPGEFRPYLQMLGFKYTEDGFILSVKYGDAKCFRRRLAYAETFINCLKALDKTTTKSLMTCVVRNTLRGITTQELLELHAKKLAEDIINKIQIQKELENE